MNASTALFCTFEALPATVNILRHQNCHVTNDLPARRSYRASNIKFFGMLGVIAPLAPKSINEFEVRCSLKRNKKIDGKLRQ